MAYSDYDLVILLLGRPRHDRGRDKFSQPLGPPDVLLERDGPEGDRSIVLQPSIMVNIDHKFRLSRDGGIDVKDHLETHPYLIH